MNIRKGKAKYLAMASGLAATLAVSGAAVWLMRDDRCSRQCTAAVTLAERHAERGGYFDAITVLDGADASCGCARFTEGDEPPEYSAMRFYLKRYREQAGEDAIGKIADDANGPILRELAGKPR